MTREAGSWCGPSEMEGHFSPGNELIVSQQICPISTRPCSSGRWMGLSHWSSHLARGPLHLVKAADYSGHSHCVVQAGRMRGGGGGRVRAEGSPRKPLLPTWGSRGTRELPRRCCLPPHPERASRVGGQVRLWEGGEDRGKVLRAQKSEGFRSRCG